MPKVSRGEFDLLKDQFIAYQKSKMRIASECDIAVGVLLWKEYDTGMDWTRVSEGRVGNEDLDVGEFIGDVSAPGGPRRYNIYNGPWYIEKERHGKEGR